MEVAEEANRYDVVNDLLEAYEYYVKISFRHITDLNKLFAAIYHEALSQNDCPDRESDEKYQVA